MFKGVVMPRRVFLLFILFLAVAGFYASVTRESVPRIASRQQVQTEQFNQIDSVAISGAAEDTVSVSGD